MILQAICCCTNDSRDVHAARIPYRMQPSFQVFFLFFFIFFISLFGFVFDRVKFGQTEEIQPVMGKAANLCEHATRIVI